MASTALKVLSEIGLTVMKGDVSDVIHNRQPKYWTFAQMAATTDHRARLRGRDLFREHLKVQRPVFDYGQFDLLGEEEELLTSAASRREAKQTDLMD